MSGSARTPAVLGLCSFTHDSAAALISSGSLTGMAEEERLSGVKHTRDYPAGAVRWLLTEAGISAADVDIVAYNFDGYRYLGGIAGSVPYLLNPETRSRALPRAASFAVVCRRFRRRMQKLREAFPNARVRGTLHHKAHGLYAFAGSGFSDAAVLVVDSLGETCTTSIAAASRTGDRVRYRVAETVSDPASLGYAYGAVTAHLGWRRGDEEGTVMALAALGDPARFRDLLAQAIPLTRTGSRSTRRCSRCGCSGRAGRGSRPCSPPRPARPAAPPRKSPRSTRTWRRRFRSAPSRSSPTWPAAPGRSREPSGCAWPAG